MEELDDVKEFLPPHADVSELKYEGSDIVIYTDSEEFFLDNSDTVKEIVSKLKKRVEVRPSSKLYSSPEKAREKVKDIVDEEAG
ncbi:MAG: beta-CASP ribonuclease aCPSF1, partial [Candidatus Nanohalobium sp.]